MDRILVGEQEGSNIKSHFIFQQFNETHKMLWAKTEQG